MGLAASLALVESGQWRRTGAFLSQIRVDLQIRIDHLEVSEAEVWMLAMAKGPPTTFGRIVGRLPVRMVEVCTSGESDGAFRTKMPTRFDTAELALEEV